MNRSCFFIGHREAGDAVRPLLEEAVECHIAHYGVTQFIVGEHGSFDRMAANAVIKAKQQHPEISLMLLLPYHPAEHKIELPQGFDGSYYPFESNIPPRRFAIIKANEMMIHTCDFLIAYAWHPASNARTLVEKAMRLQTKGGIHVENLGQNWIGNHTVGIAGNL